jgi:hypothetical protein
MSGDNRFDSLETDGATDLSGTKPKSKVTIEEVVEFMVNSKVASIHIDQPTIRPSDGYKEVKYRLISFKQ